MTDTLPARTCSRCDRWSPRSELDKESGTLVALCSLDGVIKRGSDKCSAWARKSVVKVAVEEDWAYFG